MNEEALSRSLWAFALTSLTTPFASILLVELLSSHLKPGIYTRAGLLAGIAYPACGYSVGAYHLADAISRARKRELVLMSPVIFFLPPAIWIAYNPQPSPQLLGTLLIGFCLGPSILSEVFRRLANNQGYPDSAQVFVAHHLISLMVVTSLFLEQTARHLTTWWLFTVFSHFFFWFESGSNSQPPKAR